MKKILINLLIFVVVIAIIIILLLSFGNSDGSRYVYKGNEAYKIINIKPKEYQCSECGMDVEDLNYMVQVIAKNGDTYFFDDIGCVVLWLKNHQLPIVKIFTKTLDTHKWVEAKKVRYSRIEHDPMGYGFAAMEKGKEGFVSYDEMRMLMLQGQNLHDPFVKKKLLGQ